MNFYVCVYSVHKSIQKSCNNITINKKIRGCESYINNGVWNSEELTIHHEEN